MKKQSFQIGIPLQTINIDMEAISECMVRGLRWWANTKGPYTDCPFIICNNSCSDLCGKLFIDVNLGRNDCPFKRNFSEVVLKALVEKILNEIGK
jgi:hypothetical protein